VGKLKITAIRIDEDDLAKAKNLGINVSQVCRNAVKEAIRRMEGTYPS
jgi:post-segregation antitoxin (ccd killing protein)